jgi:hypothetical protein
VSESRLPQAYTDPESPVGSDYTSSTISPVSPPELRRVPDSYHDLRSAATDHSSKPPRLETPLLPSPIAYDIGGPDEPLFRFHNPRLVRSTNEYKSYDDLHILSCYYDDSKTASLQDIEKQLDDGRDNHSEDLMEEVDDANSSTTDTEDAPVTPRNQARRSTVCSEESDWLASTRSHSERLRRFKARYYQVVQHPVSTKRQESKEDQIVSVLF